MWLLADETQGLGAGTMATIITVALGAFGTLNAVIVYLYKRDQDRRDAEATALKTRVSAFENQLTTELADCKKHHVECEEKHNKLAVEVAYLKGASQAQANVKEEINQVRILATKSLDAVAKNLQDKGGQT